MMKYMIELGLFSLNNEKLVCYSLAKRLDQSMTSSPKMRNIISGIKENHDSVMIKSCKKRKEKKRIEENIEDRNTPFSFSLNKETTYEKLNLEYREKLKEEIEKLNLGLSFIDFVDSLVAKGYKYKNFLMAYKTWCKKDFNKNKSTESNSNNKFGGWSD